MDYRMLYEKLVAEAEENGLGGEFVDWGISISKWRADPVALALYGWLLENEPEGMAAKSERQIDWEMGIVGTASSRRFPKWRSSRRFRKVLKAVSGATRAVLRPGFALA